MTLISPVVERELRVALRRSGVRARWISAGRTAGLVTIVIVAFAAFEGRTANGRLLFNLLFLGGSIAVIRGGIQLTSDLFSEERRNGTLGLLVLTGLQPLEIFASKLASAFLAVLYQVGVGFPFLAVAFVMGGVQFDQFAGAAGYLLTVLALCAALGTLASVLHRDAGAAQFTAIGLVGAVAIVPWGLHWLSGAVTATGSLRGPAGETGVHWIGLSPVHGAMEIFLGVPGGAARFWSDLGSMLLVAFSALLAGAMALHATWRDEAFSGVGRGWRPGWWKRWSGRTSGSRDKARPAKRGPTTGQPYVWVAARHRQPAAVAKGMLGTVLVIGGVGLGLGGQVWMNGGMFILLSMLAHLGVNWAISYAAAFAIATERREAGLEILLTTPLGPAAIVDGQKRALIRQFHGVLAVTFALDAFWCLAGLFVLNVPGKGFLAVLTHGVCWLLMIWFWSGAHWKSAFRSMWIAVWTGRAAYATLRGGSPISWPYFVIGGLLWKPWLATFPHGDWAELILLGVFLILAALSAFGVAGQYRAKLVEELRDIACTPIPRTADKAFGNWDPEKIKPPDQWRNWVEPRKSSQSLPVGR